MIIRRFAICFCLLNMLLADCGTAFAQAKASTSVKSIEADVPEESNQTLWTHGSLIFDKKTSEWLNEAVKSHDQQIPIEILLPSLFPATNQTSQENLDKPKDETKTADAKPNTPPEAPNFYLKSILYFSRDNWSLWLNKKMFSATTDRVFDNINLMHVTRYSASFLWKKAQIDLIYPNWKDVFINMEDNKYVSPEKNIIIDSLTGDILFILKPNQTFSSKLLQIVEGPAKNVAPTPQTAASTTAKTTKNQASAQDKTKEIKTSDRPTSDRPTVDTLDGLKNFEILKSLLNSNIEQLR